MNLFQMEEYLYKHKSQKIYGKNVTAVLSK